MPPRAFDHRLRDGGRMVPTGPVRLNRDHLLAQSLLGLWILKDGLSSTNFTGLSNGLSPIVGAPGGVGGGKYGPGLIIPGAVQQTVLSTGLPASLVAGNLTACCVAMRNSLPSSGPARVGYICGTNGGSNTFGFEFDFGNVYASPSDQISVGAYGGGSVSNIVLDGASYVSGTALGNDVWHAAAVSLTGAIAGNSFAIGGAPNTGYNNVSIDGTIAFVCLYSATLALPLMLLWTLSPFSMLESAEPMGAFWWVGGGGGTTVALVGATATTAAGTFYPALTFLLPGAAAATTAGNLSISEIAPIPGAAAAAAAGNFSIAETIPVTGAAAATAAGIFSLSESFTLTGVAAATAAGNIGVSIGTTVPLIGAAAAATAGTISLSESFTLPAAAATAAAGILGATTGIVVSLTGVTATAAAAPLGISTTVTLAGAAAATAAGAFGIDLALALAGAAAATAAGTITPYTGTVLLQGAAVATAAGIILVETVNPATMTVLVNFTILPPTLPAPNPPPATGPGDVLVTFGT